MKIRRSIPWAIAGLGLVGLVYAFISGESRFQQDYQRIQVGMSVDEVQAILGPGTPVKQREIPTTVVPVNPEDARAADERARKLGQSPPTTREYPTRHKPLVEGDYILRWTNSHGERILVGFRDGKVCEKDYYDPNYL